MATWLQPRYSLRWLFIAMTVIAVALVASRWWWLRAVDLERRAAQLEAQVQGYADTAWGIQRFGGFTEEANSEAQKFWDAYLQAQLQATQLRRAKWRPWLNTETQRIGDPYHTK